MQGPASRKVRNSLWFVPVVCVLIGLALSVVTNWIDEAFDHEIVPTWLTGDPDTAVAILSTIAASMVSLATLVLTITMVVVQLAMGQFSPRIVQTILQDKPSQIAIGLFIATFAHSMVSLPKVRFEGTPTVPGLAIVVAYALVLVSIVVLVLYVHHIGRSLRVSALIELVGSDTRRLLDEQYPGGEEIDVERAGSGRPTIVRSRRSGVICDVRTDRLVEAARAADCTLELVPTIGQFVPAGSVLFRVEGDPDRLDVDQLYDAVVLGLERTLERDVAYGFRMLVDIAIRSVSESPFLDPTTAVQAIDRLHDALRQIVGREFPDGVHRDDDGRVRLRVPVMDWDAYVLLSFEELRLAGAGSPQVSRRMIAALEDLLEVAPTERRPVLRRELELLRAAVDGVDLPGSDLAFDLRPDEQGIGAAASSTERPLPR